MTTPTNPTLIADFRNPSSERDAMDDSFAGCGCGCDGDCDCAPGCC